jgi:hypothetical protein
MALPPSSGETYTVGSVKSRVIPRNVVVLKNTMTLDKAQKTDTSNSAPSSKTFADKFSLWYRHSVSEI